MLTIHSLPWGMVRTTSRYFLPQPLKLAGDVILPSGRPVVMRRHVDHYTLILHPSDISGACDTYIYFVEGRHIASSRHSD